MPVTIALLRTPDASISECELTHMERGGIDFSEIKRQHQTYSESLKKFGIKIEMIPELKGSPDGVFVEDAALVLEELAIICRPGADSRKHETESVKKALGPYRKNILEIKSPGTVDGGDLLKIERTIYVGQSSRTNKEAFEQFKSLLSPIGYEVKEVPVRKCLHLKTGACYLGENTVLINPDWVDRKLFKSMKIIEVDPAEPFASNAIRFNDTVIHAEGYPLTKEIILAAGFKVESVLISELAKAEAGLTCLSLIFGVENVN